MAEINFKWIAGQEGHRNYGVLPKISDKGRESGLTIGTGIDLAYHTEADLRAAGVLEEDIKNSLPWLGSPGSPGPRGSQIMTKGSPYDAAVRVNGKKVEGTGKLIWDDQSLINMHEHLMKKSIKNAKRVYENLTQKPNSFDRLTSAQQTVLVDLTYNGGASFIYETIDLQAAIRNEDWDEIEKEFASKDWAEKDIPRHNDRARLLSDERDELYKKALITQ